MGKVIRVKAHLTVEEIDARLKHFHDFWRIRRWLVIRHALVDESMEMLGKIKQIK